MSAQEHTVVIWHDGTRDELHGGYEYCVVQAAGVVAMTEGQCVEIVGVWEAAWQGSILGWMWRYRNDTDWRPLTQEQITDMDAYGRLPIVADDDLNLELLPIGGRIPIRGQDWVLRRRSPKSWVFEVAGKPRRLTFDTEKWDQFIRDVRSVYTASRHGVDGGCLCDLWPPRKTGLRVRKL